MWHKLQSPNRLRELPPRPQGPRRGLERIAYSGENDWRCFLLAECVEAYTNLDEAQQQRLQALLTTEQYQEVRPLVMTTYERGMVEGQRRTALLQLGKRFGPLSAEVKQRVEALPPDELEQLLLNLVEGQSLKELHLED